MRKIKSEIDLGTFQRAETLSIISSLDNPLGCSADKIPSLVVFFIKLIEDRREPSLRRITLNTSEISFMEANLIESISVGKLFQGKKINFS